MRMICLKPDDSRVYFTRIAEMHASQIHHGLLPQLGRTFLSALYREVSGAPQGIVIAAFNDQDIVGFVAGSRDLGLMYKHILIKKGWLLLWYALPYLLRIDILSKVWHVTLYPNRSIEVQNKTQPSRTPTPELLAIAVSETFQRHGIGGQLIVQFERWLTEARRFQNYRVATNAAEIASNAFYQRHGFRMIGTQDHNDLTLKVYENKLDFTGKKKKETV